MKARFDSYYTPSWIADELISFCTVIRPEKIADFAAGFGSLLYAAKLKYPNSNFFLNDISPDCVSHLATEYPDWHSFNIDFYDLKAIQIILDDYFCKETDKFDLILLNPPFSHRGGASKTVHFNNVNFKCSPALAFVINSLSFLKSDGELIALLPAGCLTTDKDEIARTILNKHYNVTLAAKFSNKIFSGCSVSTVCLKISKKSSEINFKSSDVDINSKHSNINVKLFRGKIPVFSLEAYVSSSGFRTVHTTNLKNGKIVGESMTVSKNNSTVVGPCILIPRVCKPSLNKIVIYQHDEPITLTDCVIAVITDSYNDLFKIYDLICLHWSLLELSYSGTCAQYITLKKLNIFFKDINIDSTISRDTKLLQNEAEFLPV